MVVEFTFATIYAIYPEHYSQAVDKNMRFFDNKRDILNGLSF